MKINTPIHQMTREQQTAQYNFLNSFSGFSDQEKKRKEELKNILCIEEKIKDKVELTEEQNFYEAFANRGKSVNYVESDGSVTVKDVSVKNVSKLGLTKEETLEQENKIAVAKILNPANNFMAIKRQALNI